MRWLEGKYTGEGHEEQGEGVDEVFGTEEREGVVRDGGFPGVLFGRGLAESDGQPDSNRQE